MTFISIIIPFNNIERYLKDCLESLKEEELEDIETIIILNGVKNKEIEKVNELIKEYEDDLNIVIKSFEEELGVAKARNIGLEIATGKYIYFIDGDDYVYTNGLSDLINLAKESDADFINGKRVRTYYIKDRFDEALQKRNYDFLDIFFDEYANTEDSENSDKEGNSYDIDEEETEEEKRYNDLESSVQQLVSKYTREEEVLTVLHSLIKNEIINPKTDEKKIRFEEDKKFFSDYSFIVKVFNRADSFKSAKTAIYTKRLRDDPINNPSLNQEAGINKFQYAIDEYTTILPLIEEFEDLDKKKLLKEEINRKLLKFYYNRYSRQFRSNKNDEWRSIYFDKMSEVSQKIDLDIVKKNKKEIKALQNHDKEKVIKYMNRRLGSKKAKRIIKKRSRKIFNKTVYLNKFNKEEIIENRIVFESFRGDFYSDSPKYIYEYLLKTYGDKFEYVWVINDRKTKIPGNPKKIKRGSLKFYRYLSSSKYWVFNGRQYSNLLKRDEQVLLETWHGTPLKKLGLDLENLYSGSPRYQKQVYKDAIDWNYLVSPNKYTTDILRRAFAYEGEILEVGYPRNDILVNADDEYRNKIKDKLKLPKDKKIILYAPTWRDDEFFEKGQYKFELKLELDRLKEELGDEYIILTRVHYLVANRLELGDYKGFAVDVSDYDDIAELYLISDILITDYSSVFFDYAILKRPILFYTYDLNKYRDVIRGFYFDMEKEVPGPLLYTTEEVIDSIKNIDDVSEEFKEKYKEFYQKFCSIEDGQASKRIVDRVWGRK